MKPPQYLVEIIQDGKHTTMSYDAFPIHIFFEEALIKIRRLEKDDTNEHIRKNVGGTKRNKPRNKRRNKSPLQK